VSRGGVCRERRLGCGGWDSTPVAVRGARMRMLVAAGSARRKYGMLDWLLEAGRSWRRRGLVPLGEGRAMEAPALPRARTAGHRLQGAGGPKAKQAPRGRLASHCRAAAYVCDPRAWGASRGRVARCRRLPGRGGRGDALDLVRLVDGGHHSAPVLRLRRSALSRLAFS